MPASPMPDGPQDACRPTTSRIPRSRLIRSSSTSPCPILHLRWRQTPASLAAAHLDAGTSLLLRSNVALASDGHLLDLGAGSGAMAMTMARRSPASTVWAVDVNSRARDLCRRNVKRNNLTNIRVATPDDIPEGRTIFQRSGRTPRFESGSPLSGYCSSPGWPGLPTTEPQRSSSKSIWAPIRCSGGLLPRATRPNGSPRSRGFDFCWSALGLNRAL